MSEQAMQPASGAQEHDREPVDGAELLRSILDTSNEAFIAIDDGGRVVEFNREAERTFGFSREQVLGREMADTIVPERYRAAHRAGVRRYAATGQGSMVGRRVELSALHREGHEFPIEMTISEARMPRQGRPVRTFHAFVHDISERKLSERVLVAMQSVTRAMALADSPERAMRSLLSTLGESMGWQVGAYWGLSNDNVLRRLASWVAEGVQAAEFEAAGDELPASRQDSLPGRALALGEPVWIQDYGADDSFPRAQAARRAGLRAAIGVPVRRKADVVGVIEFFASEIRVRDRSITGALATMGAQVGELLEVLEERQAMMTSLARLALTDQLTRLPNRRAWKQGLQRELARADRDGGLVCVAVIDLDNFKRFNDEHGHLAGDAFLFEAARAWQTELRASDLLARYGGEEFAAAIPALPPATAMAVVERLRAATPAALTASAGMASWDGSETAIDLFGRADAALYEAKQRGRNRAIAAD